MQTKIKTISGLIAYVKENSAWQAGTIRNVIQALGYTATGGADSLKDLSCQLVNCAEHGADSGFPGFCSSCDTIAFFRKNRNDIIKNMELMAEELGGDIVEMVQGFGVFRGSPAPTPAQVGRALWDTAYIHKDLHDLYNVFAWFCLEEISSTWYRYLEDNPGYRVQLSA